MDPNQKQTTGLMKAEFKAVIQAGAELPDNQIRVCASTTGNPDAYGRIIFPGAFKPVVKQFIDSGAMLIGHDWGDMPIGMIMDAKETGNQLLVDSQFHSTDDAQDARTICKERMDAGKTVPVSIGWYPDYENGVAWFESGDKLLQFAKDNGYDLNLFDSKAIKKLSFCMAITGIEYLVEFSLVTVGANPNAAAIHVQSMTFDDQFTGALGALDSLIARWEGLGNMREQLGETHREKLSALVLRLEQIAAKTSETSLGDVDPNAPDPESRFAELAFRTMAHRSQLQAS